MGPRHLCKHGVQKSVTGLLKFDDTYAIDIPLHIHCSLLFGTFAFDTDAILEDETKITVIINNAQ